MANTHLESGWADALPRINRTAERFMIMKMSEDSFMECDNEDDEIYNDKKIGRLSGKNVKEFEKLLVDFFTK